MGGVFTKIKDWFFIKKMELVVVGLEHCGKTTFANHIAYGEPKRTLPTIGLNVRYAKKGSKYTNTNINYTLFY
jgi:GTPase SAR1 family protein